MTFFIIHTFLSRYSEALESGVGVSILRVKDGLDVAHLLAVEEKHNHATEEHLGSHLHKVASETSLGYDNNSTLGEDLEPAEEISAYTEKSKEKKKKKPSKKKVAKGSVG